MFIRASRSVYPCRSRGWRGSERLPTVCKAKFAFDNDPPLQYDESKDPKQKANWLPAPEGNFYAVLRMYGPEKQILDGSWKSPPVELLK